MGWLDSPPPIHFGPLGSPHVAPCVKRALPGISATSWNKSATFSLFLTPVKVIPNSKKLKRFPWRLLNIVSCVLNGFYFPSDVEISDWQLLCYVVWSWIQNIYRKEKKAQEPIRFLDLTWPDLTWPDQTWQAKTSREAHAYHKHLPARNSSQCFPKFPGSWPLPVQDNLSAVEADNQVYF